MLYAFKHHLRQQQVDLMYARTSDYRHDISGAWRKNKGQEDFGVSLYHLLAGKASIATGNKVNAEQESESSSSEEQVDENEVERKEDAA